MWFRFLAEIVDTMVMESSTGELKKIRRVPRRAILCKAGLLISGKFHIGSVHEIGEGGCLIKAVVPMVMGQKMVVTFHLQKVGNIVVRGTVAYQRPEESKDLPEYYGISFDESHFELNRRIRNFVASSAII